MPSIGTSSTNHLSHFHPQSIGDIHHFAWRPSNVDSSIYREPIYGGDAKLRYKDWFPGECHAKECLSVRCPSRGGVHVAPV